MGKHHVLEILCECRSESSCEHHSVGLRGELDSTGKCPTHGWGWNEMIFKVPSLNPNHSKSLLNALPRCPFLSETNGKRWK